VTLTFLEPVIQGYAQFGWPFQSGLSIIDVLMFNDPGLIRKMLNDRPAKPKSRDVPN
jgi:hypothetical protein